MNFEFKIEGLDEVTKAMASAKNQLGGLALGKAVKSGGEVIKEKAIDNAKQIDDSNSPEKIWENIALKIRRNNKEETITAKVGVLGGAQGGRKQPSTNPGGDTRYWRHIEFGTSKTPANPFMRRALSESASKVSESVVSSLKKSVSKLK
jgi:HK97 gp10 family phage protein